jgi:hypothetical protein
MPGKNLYVPALFAFLLLAGCGQKKFEDTDTFKELMKKQEETDKKLDSIRKENYKQVTDSVNSSFQKSMDSLRHITDSLRDNLNKNIESLKNK